MTSSEPPGDALRAPAASHAPPSPSDRPVLIRWSGLTHRGKIRPNNEDTFLALNFDGHEVRYLGKSGESLLTNSDFLFAVSDGMGGAQSGEFASRIAVDRITRLMPKSFKMAAAGMASGFSDILTTLFDSVHRDLLLLGASYEECAGMGATLSLCWVTPGWVYFGHLGDSRIYYLPAQGGISQVSHDHNHVGWLRRKGQISEREARMHPMRHAIDQAVGAGHQNIEPHVGAVGYAPGDRFLICSDGVVDGLWDRHLDELLREPPPQRVTQTPAQRIVEEAVESSGRDNVTAVVFEILAPPPSSEDPPEKA